MPRDTRDVADVTSDPATAATGKTAVLYRIALPNHLCPAGQKARWLLERKGYEVDDRLFRARSEVDAFIVSPNNNHPNEGGGLAQGSDKGKGRDCHRPNSDCVGSKTGRRRHQPDSGVCFDKSAKSLVHRRPKCRRVRFGVQSDIKPQLNFAYVLYSQPNAERAQDHEVDPVRSYG